MNFLRKRKIAINKIAELSEKEPVKVLSVKGIENPTIIKNKVEPDVILNFDFSCFVCTFYLELNFFDFVDSTFVFVVSVVNFMTFLNAILKYSDIRFLVLADAGYD